MLKQLFSSRVRVKLLTIFLTNPDARFYTRELSRLLEESPYAVQRELYRLESIGLLKAEHEANIKYYTVDKRCPIYPELKNIILKATGMGDTLREVLAGLVDLLELSEIIALMEGQLRRELAIHLFQQGKLSFGKAREMAGITVWAYQQLLGSREIPVHYDVADYEEDLATLKEIGWL